MASAWPAPCRHVVNHPDANEENRERGKSALPLHVGASENSGVSETSTDSSTSQKTLAYFSEYRCWVTHLSSRRALTVLPSLTEVVNAASATQRMCKA